MPDAGEGFAGIPIGAEEIWTEVVEPCGGFVSREEFDDGKLETERDGAVGFEGCADEVVCNGWPLP